MSLFNFLMILIIIILSYVLTFLFAKRKARVYLIIAITFLWVALGGVTYNYITNEAFRLSVDLKFKQVSEHVNLSDKDKPSLALPKDTVFAYRYSEDSAAYFTMQSYNKITTFFNQLADKHSYNEYVDPNNGDTNLNLKYNNCLYTIKINKRISPKGYSLYVESK